MVGDLEDRGRDDLVVGELVGLVDAAKDRQARLMVHVHEEHVQALAREGVPEVLRGGGLAGAALLVGYGDDLCAHDVPFSIPS